MLDGITSFQDQPGIDLNVSTDEGETWSSVAIAPQSRDWVKIFGGVASAASTQRVMYVLSPSPIAGNWAGIFPPPDKQYVYKSLDGGTTWQDAGTLPLDPATVAGGSANDYIMFGAGAVAPDGTVVLGYRLCTQLAVATSHDEGQTWTTLQVTGARLPAYDATDPLSLLGNENAITGEPIAVDSSGNLYAVWEDASNVPHLSTSRDMGQSWSAPVVVLASADDRALRRSGREDTGNGRHRLSRELGWDDVRRLHRRNEQRARPVAHVLVVRREPFPCTPTASSPDTTSRTSRTGATAEFVQVKYAPSGDVWASFVKDMCRNPTGDCTWNYASHANSRFQGAAGLLVHRP